MYFLTTLYRVIKIIAALGLLISGAIIIAYAVSYKSDALSTLSGVILLGSLLLFFDSSKVFADLRKVTDDLIAHEKRLRKTLIEYDLTTTKLQTEVKTLAGQVVVRDKQIQTTNEQLNRQQDQLIRQEQINVEEAKHLQFIKTESEAYYNENIKLREQVAKIQVMYEQTKKLVAQLILSEGELKLLGQSLNNNIDRVDTIGDKLDKTAQVLIMMTQQIATKKFNEIDINKDGLIERHEFDAFAK